MSTQTAREWAIATLDEVAESASRKTALKAARAAHGDDAIVSDCLLVARRKRDAYAAALRGEQASSVDWVNRDPELAAATLAIGACGLPVSDIPMMFAEPERPGSILVAS
jgi:hypothetical protein